MKTLLLGLITLLFTQDSDYHKVPEIRDVNEVETKLRDRILWLETRNHDLQLALEKQQFRITVEKQLLDRFLIPVDAWLDVLGPNTEDLSIIKWYLLLIRSENVHRGSDIWIKFYLVDSEKGSQLQQDDGSWEPDSNMSYTKRKRNSLADVLEHYFVQLLDDPGSVITMKDGTAHLYRIPDEKFPVEKVIAKPKDFLIY